MLQWFNELMQTFASKVTQVLPLSPFLSIRSSWVAPPEGLSWLNWFIPVGDMMEIFAAWLTAYGLYLLYRIILRWINAVS